MWRQLGRALLSETSVACGSFLPETAGREENWKGTKYPIKIWGQIVLGFFVCKRFDLKTGAGGTGDGFLLVFVRRCGGFGGDETFSTFSGHLEWRAKLLNKKEEKR